VLVGEMRDLETIAAAITIAETGHLVFGTLHTMGAAQTVDRIVDVFPSYQQQQIRMQLAGGLKAVISQALLARKSGGRVAAREIMVVTQGISSMIREGKTHQLYGQIQTGAAEGMMTMEMDVSRLLSRDIITYDTAIGAVNDVKTFLAMIDRIPTQAAALTQQPKAAPQPAQKPQQHSSQPPPRPAPQKDQKGWWK
jgi:twitching motility protein PilT